VDRARTWPERAAIILAGGEGSRPSSLTAQINGEHVPKQYCRLLSEKTLLEQTRSRVSLAVDLSRAVIVVTQRHERFYRPLLGDDSPAITVAQPENRGTAVAILYAFLRLAKIAGDPVVGIFPCDHYVSDDATFMHHVELAFRVVAARPKVIMLLGIKPDHPEPHYGWIDPGEAFMVDSTEFFRVKRFWEKPDAPTARKLQSDGCLWNSFVFAARASTLMLAMIRSVPDLCSAFWALWPSLGTPAEEDSVRKIYQAVPAADFSTQVLGRCPEGLVVLPVTGVEWSDLGEPDRVFQLLHRPEIGLRGRSSTLLEL
jgi:mannose-1-phosphate guanylyltransferase